MYKPTGVAPPMRLLASERKINDSKPILILYGFYFPILLEAYKKSSTCKNMFPVQEIKWFSVCQHKVWGRLNPGSADLNLLLRHQWWRRAATAHCLCTVEHVNMFIESLLLRTREHVHRKQRPKPPNAGTPKLAGVALHHQYHNIQ